MFDVVSVPTLLVIPLATLTFAAGTVLLGASETPGENGRPV
jgi:hypothetical protein